MAGYTKRIICLANSNRNGGRCVAGIDVDSVAQPKPVWIRPVPSLEERAIPKHERRYISEIGDVIEIEFVKPAPHGCQGEDHLVQAKSQWKKVDCASWQQVQKLPTEKPPLWAGGDSAKYSTKHGKQNVLPETEAEKFDSSLMLVKPQDLFITVSVDNPKYSKRKTVRTVFNLGPNTSTHALTVTDSMFESEYSYKGVGEYPIEDALLCLSLVGPYPGRVMYKLVAGILTPERFKQP